MSQIRIGISGWNYPPWRGVFYPAGLARRRELEFASRQLNSIEINGSFYSLQRPEHYRAWHEATPDDFVFAVKGGRFITHMKLLRDVEVPLANFFASGVLCLGRKLGPILWQLPPRFPFDAGRLAAFFRMLPRDTAAAARLARGHDQRVAGRAWTRSGHRIPLRHALEVRHPSFAVPEFIQLLREHQIAVVVADTAGRWPLIEDVTADFVYVRLHGDKELYVSGYTDEALKHWARRVRAWTRGGTTATGTARSSGRDVYVYFDNDVKAHAPFDAMSLAHELGLGPAVSRPPNLGGGRETARRDWPGFARPRAAAARRASRDDPAGAR